MRNFQVLVVVLFIGLPLAGCGGSGGGPGSNAIKNPATKDQLSCTELKKEEWQGIKISLSDEEKKEIAQECKSLQPSCVITLENILRSNQRIASPKVLLEISESLVYEFGSED